MNPETDTAQPEEQQPQQQPQTPQPPERKSRAEIARELFGNEYKGEVPAKEPAPPKIEEPTPVNTEADDTPVEEPTEGERPDVGDEEPAPAEDTGETPIATMSELVEHYGLDPEWAKTLKVPVSVDGTPTEATISDLVKSYQIAEAAEHRLELAKSYQAQQGEAWASKHAELEGHFQVLAELIKHEEASLEREVKAIDPKLRDEDPAEWAARVQEFNARRGQISQIKNATVEKYKAVADARAREGEAIKNQYLIDQHHILLEKLPEWKDAKRAEADKAEIATYLVNTAGFSPAELADLMDHRQVMVARKAMLYDKSRGQVDTAKKRVVKVPRIMRPGAPKPAEQRASERLAGLKAKLAKTGSIDDALAYRLAKRGVSR